MLCRANNCPCLGTLKGLCYYHDSREPSDWPNITETLQTNARLLTAITWCFTEGQYKHDEKARNALERLADQYPDLTPKDDEGAKLWAYRAMHWLSERTKDVSYSKAAGQIRLRQVAEKAGIRLRRFDHG